MAESIRVTGLKEAQKALYAYSQQLGDFAVYKSLRAGANVVLKQARANAPEGKTGKLKRGIVVMKSKLNNGKRSPLLGVTITIRKRKGDPFYGRFQEDGWNTRGPSSEGLGKRLDRFLIRRQFGSRTGRKTQPGKTNVPGKHFIDRAFVQRREEAVRVIQATATAASDLLAAKLGL